MTFTPVADAYVDSGNPTTNYGAATLRIYANSSSSVGYTVSRVSEDTWTETGINYNNAPAVGSSLGSSGAFSANAWTTVDVTAYITGDGTYNLAFSTTSSTNVSYSSREGANATAANLPVLVIEYHLS